MAQSDGGRAELHSECLKRMAARDLGTSWLTHVNQAVGSGNEWTWNKTRGREETIWQEGNYFRNSFAPPHSLSYYFKNFNDKNVTLFEKKSRLISVMHFLFNVAVIYPQFRILKKKKI